MRFQTTLFQAGNNTGIEVPPELLDELGGGKRPAVTVTVNGFSYPSSYRKAQVTAIEGAKAAETRARRVTAVVAELAAG